MPRLLAVLLLFASPAIAHLTGTVVQGQFDGRVAHTPSLLTMPLPAEGDSLTLRFSTGPSPAGVSLALRAPGSPPLDLTFRPAAQQLLSGRSLPDSHLEVLPWRSRVYVRPNAEFYRKERVEELAKAWETLPAASAHVLTLELRGTQLWLDGRYVNDVPRASAYRLLRLALPAGATLERITTGNDVPSSALPLDPAHFARPTLVDPTFDVRDAAVTVRGKGIDVGGLGRLNAHVDDLVSLAWRRSALDGLPEFRIASVPLDTYSHATVLCAAVDDPAKARSFTLRLTRYANSRGDALADTHVEVPAVESPDARRVGTLTHGPAGARKTVDLWLLRVPLKTGLIQDLLVDDRRRSNNYPTHRYLDVELLDPLDDVDAHDAFPPPMRPTERRYAPSTRTSAVHVFDLSLHRSPASLTVRGSLPTNAFYASDAPHLAATVDARVAGRYTLAHDVADVDGNVVATGRQDVELAAGASRTTRVPVTTSNGWYATRVRLLDDAGRALVDHRSSFVVLPPDTRTAGFESPHGAWWFHWAHGGEPNIERVGPVLQRAGLRHTILPKTLTESVTKRYGVTEWNVHWYYSKKPTMAEKMLDHEDFIRRNLALWPSLDRVLIFHESGGLGAPFPSELWDQPAPPQRGEEVEKAWQHRMEYATAAARMIREKFPQLKIQYGQDGSSLHLVAELLRRKFPRELIDAVAVEDLGQTIIPEKAIPGSMQSTWYLREVCRKLGYGDVPVNAAYEWMGRRDLALGAATQAEWYVRDALHARAYGFATIAIGTVHDAGAGYFHTLWGGGGLTRRYPAMDPKPAYAAIATLTSVLDNATFVRVVPTGSLSLYCLEFRRGDDLVYALWTPRGRRPVRVNFDGATTVRNVDLYGREKAMTGAELALTVSTGAQYLVAKSKVASVAPAGPATFPADPPPANPTVVDPLDSLASIEVQSDPDKRLERTGGEHMPHRTKGQFDVREVTDPVHGKCVEIELKPQGKTWDMMHEYVVLKFPRPVVAKGPFTHAGVWLHGNSGWGEVMWELTPERGGPWLSQGVYMDWPGHIAANFDGWNFLRLPLQPDAHWRNNVKVTGLVVTIPRKVLYVTETVPVPSLKVRLKGLCLF